MRSPDADVFIMLLTCVQDLSHEEHNVLFDIGAENKRRMINVHGVINDLSKDICYAFMPSQAVTKHVHSADMKR